MYQFWERDTVTAERKRIKQAWFDYRHVHPVLRSFIFQREYILAYQRAFKRFYGNPGKDGGDLPHGFSTPLYKRRPRTIRMIISRMHLVDELGCPYDTFFDAAFEHFMQERNYLGWHKNNEFLARWKLPPIQMLADSASLITGMKAFEKRNGIKLRLPEHPHYKAENWTGTSNQKACAHWLIKAVKNRPDRNHALARLTYEMNLLREQEVVRHMDLATVKKIRDIRSSIISHS